MWGYGVVLGSVGDGQWVTMLIFGAIAVALSLVDGAYYFGLTRGRMRGGAQRLQRHLTNMLDFPSFLRTDGHPSDGNPRNSPIEIAQDQPVASQAPRKEEQ